MDVTKEHLHNGTHEAPTEQPDAQPQQKRRRFSHSPAAEAGQVRVKKEPKERFVEIWAEYKSNGRVPQDVRMVDGESSPTTRARAVQSESDAASSTHKRSSPSRRLPAISAQLEDREEEGSQKLQFPAPGKPWPAECEIALARYAIGDEDLRDYVKCTTVGGLDAPLRRFIEMHGLTTSVASLKSKLSGWVYQYDSLSRRLSSVARYSHTDTWVDESDRGLLLEYTEMNSKNHWLKVWQNELFAKPRTGAAAPAGASSSRKSLAAVPRAAREASNQTATTGGASNARAQAQATAPRRSRAPANGAASGTTRREAGDAPSNGRPAAQPGAPASLQSELGSVRARRRDFQPVQGHLAQQATNVTNLQPQSQQHIELLTRQAALLERHDARADRQTQQIEKLTKQVQQQAGKIDQQVELLERQADTLDSVMKQLASLRALMERQHTQSG